MKWKLCIHLLVHPATYSALSLCTPTSQSRWASPGVWILSRFLPTGEYLLPTVAPYSSGGSVALKCPWLLFGEWTNEKLINWSYSVMIVWWYSVRSNFKEVQNTNIWPRHSLGTLETSPSAICCNYIHTADRPAFILPPCCLAQPVDISGANHITQNILGVNITHFIHPSTKSEDFS